MRIVGGVLCTCALVLLCLTGCGGKGAIKTPDLVPVEGTITMDDKPLAGASVMLGTGSAFGETDANGHYVLKAHGGKTGAPVGDFKVVVEKWVNPDGSVYRSTEGISPMDAGARQLIPPQYSNTEKTELKATVPAGGAKNIDFALKGGLASPKPKAGP